MKNLIKKIFVFLFCISLSLSLTDGIETISLSSNNAAINAANNFRSQYCHSHSCSKYLIVVDFTLPSDTKRLYVIDTTTNTIVLSTYVTHGVGSGAGRYATSFGNQANSHKSSLGGFITAETYTGKHGISRRIDGLQSGLNSHARDREVVIHGAEYIGKGRTGTSWGCFAVPQDQVNRLISLVGSNTILYAYYN